VRRCLTRDRFVTSLIIGMARTDESPVRGGSPDERYRGTTTILALEVA
jgi:hypothetical protein